MTDKQLKGQNKGQCVFIEKGVRCTNTGRNILAKNVQNVWGIELYYCPKHRKYGVEVFKDIVRGYLRVQDERFKDELIKELPELSEESKVIMNDYFAEKVQRVYELNELRGGLETLVDEIGSDIGSPTDPFVGSINGDVTDVCATS